MSLILQKKISGNGWEESDNQRSTEVWSKHSSRCDCRCSCACACTSHRMTFIGLHFLSPRWRKKQQTSDKDWCEHCCPAAGGHWGFGKGPRHLSAHRKWSQRQGHSELTDHTEITQRSSKDRWKRQIHSRYKKMAPGFKVITIVTAFAVVKRRGNSAI